MKATQFWLYMIYVCNKFSLKLFDMIISTKILESDCVYVCSDIQLLNE